MNLVEQRQQLIEKRAFAANKKRLEKLNKLVERIETVMYDPDVISVLEKQLVETGLVELNEFGCLCQGGFCEWQKGLPSRLQPLIKEWEAKGVRIIFSLTMTLILPPNRRHGSFEGYPLRHYFKQQKTDVPSYLNLK